MAFVSQMMTNKHYCNFRTKEKSVLCTTYGIMLLMASANEARQLQIYSLHMYCRSFLNIIAVLVRTAQYQLPFDGYLPV